MEFVGLLVKKLESTNGTGAHGEWRMATYLLETIESFPKHMVVKVFDGLSGRIAMFDALIGKNVTVYFDINARESNNRYYNEITAFGIKSNEPEPPKNE
jgi:hypothetical protein